MMYASAVVGRANKTKRSEARFRFKRLLDLWQRCLLLLLVVALDYQH